MEYDTDFAKDSHESDLPGDNMPASCSSPMVGTDAICAGTYDDMVDMGKLNDAELMRNLKARFEVWHALRRFLSVCALSLYTAGRNCVAIATVASHWWL